MKRRDLFKTFAALGGALVMPKGKLAKADEVREPESPPKTDESKYHLRYEPPPRPCRKMNYRAMDEDGNPLGIAVHEPCGKVALPGEDYCGEHLELANSVEDWRHFNACREVTDGVSATTSSSWQLKHSEILRLEPGFNTIHWSLDMKHGGLDGTGVAEAQVILADVEVARYFQHDQMWRTHSGFIVYEPFESRGVVIEFNYRLDGGGYAYIRDAHAFSGHMTL